MKLLLLLFGGLKFSKVLFSTGSMILSLGVYASIWGWRFAAGFLILLLVHELGHFVAARSRGLDVGLPTFIPFIGAWIALRDHPADAETEAYIAVAGPLAGTVAAVATYFVAREYGSTLGLAVAYSGLFLNLFNLLPVSPLDGGRIVGVVSPLLWCIGAPALIAYFVWRPSPVIVLVAILFVQQVIAYRKLRAEPAAFARYYDVPAATRASYGLLYLGLAAFLGYMANAVHDMLGAVHG